MSPHLSLSLSLSVGLYYAPAVSLVKCDNSIQTIKQFSQNVETSKEATQRVGELCGAGCTRRADSKTFICSHYNKTKSRTTRTYCQAITTTAQQ